jgi:hypothetical protein
MPASGATLWNAFDYLNQVVLVLLDGNVHLGVAAVHQHGIVRAEPNRDQLSEGGLYALVRISCCRTGITYMYLRKAVCRRLGCGGLSCV